MHDLGTLHCQPVTQELSIASTKHNEIFSTLYLAIQCWMEGKKCYFALGSGEPFMLHRLTCCAFRTWYILACEYPFLLQKYMDLILCP